MQSMFFSLYTANLPPRSGRSSTACSIVEIFTKLNFEQLIIHYSSNFVSNREPPMPYFHGSCICSLQWKISYSWADFPLLWGLIEMAALLNHPRELWVKIWCRLHLLMVEITSWLIGFIYAVKQPMLLSEFIDCCKTTLSSTTAAT